MFAMVMVMIMMVMNHVCHGDGDYNDGHDHVCHGDGDDDDGDQIYLAMKLQNV